MQVLIVGCGYVGLRAAEFWTERGHMISALTRSAERAEDWRRRGWQAVIGDVTQQPTLRDLPSADVGLFGVGYDRNAAATQAEVYVQGLANVLHATQGRVGRWIYLSSTSVYGQSQGEWVNEDSPCTPTTAGGRCCLAAEQLLQEACPEPGASVALRLGGIYGPGRLIGRVDQLRAQHPLAVDPEGWLNLIHVEDIVTIMDAAATASLPGRTLIATDGRPLRRRDFYAALAEQVGAPAPRFEGGERALNKRCDNRQLLKNLGVTLQHADARRGISRCV